MFKFLLDLKSKKMKKVWDSLAKENAKYYIYSPEGTQISEEQFRESGKRDFENYIKNDPNLKGVFKPDTRVLEIGCGIGRITEFIATEFAHVYGIDVSSAMINKAKDRLSSRYPNISFIETNGIDYPFEADYLDFIFSFIVFQHIPSKDIIYNNLKECYRVLKKDGIVKVQVRGVAVESGQWYSGFAFGEKDVEELISNTKFKIINAEGYGQRYLWLTLRKS